MLYTFGTLPDKEPGYAKDKGQIGHNDPPKDEPDRGEETEPYPDTMLRMPNVLRLSGVSKSEITGDEKTGASLSPLDLASAQ